MRVWLKGINSKRKTLADGRRVTYYYVWKGGPRLLGSPGTPEFVAAYNEAVRHRSASPVGTLLSIMRAYQESGEFRNLAPRTRADYVKQIGKIEREFGDFPLSALPDRRTRGEFLAWRDRLAINSKRQADYVFGFFPNPFLGIRPRDCSTKSVRKERASISRQPLRQNLDRC
jgi:hypothetical protein